MTFSIKATIRACWAPEHRLSCPSRRWREIFRELDRRGDRRHEAGAFLLGSSRHGRRSITDVVYYDELDSDAYASGVCILHGDAFAMLWAICRERGCTVVADVHTHAGLGFQSHSDKTNPMVAREGHIAIILPDFAHWPIAMDRMGIYEYRGDHNWINHSPKRAPAFFYIGFWS